MDTPKSLSLARSGGLENPAALGKFMGAVQTDLHDGKVQVQEIGGGNALTREPVAGEIPLVELTWKGQPDAVEGESIRITYHRK